MLSTISDRCGIADYTRDLVCAMADLEVEAVPFSLDKEQRGQPAFFSELAERVRAANVDVVHVQYDQSFFGEVPTPNRLRGRGLANKIVHPPLPPPNGFFEALRALQKPVVITLHELAAMPSRTTTGLRVAWRQALTRYAYRLTYSTASVVVAHSQRRAMDLAALGVDPRKVRMVPLGVTPSGPLPERNRARKNLGVHKQVVLFTFGFLSPRKRIEDLVSVLAGLPLNVRLVVAGGEAPGVSGYLASLKALAKTMGLQDRVEFLGHVSEKELSMWLSATDIYLLVPRKMGGGSLSVNAAVSAGLPIVAWEIPEMRELQSRFSCLELVPVGDLEAYANTVLRLIDDVDERKTVATKTVAAALRCDIRVEATATLGLYYEAQRLGPQIPSTHWRWTDAIRACQTDDENGPLHVRDTVLRVRQQLTDRLR